MESLERADIIIGIPCYNNQETVGHVVRTVQQGLNKYYRDLRSIVMVSDGGSVDDSREGVEQIKPNPWSETLCGIYRGIPGKGCALRSIFEAAKFLKVRACLLFDADLRSITPEWIKNMAEPILSGKYDYVSPYYRRYKYDGTITNLIVYHLTRSLYGLRVRQPIGGDFALSLPVIEDYLEYDVWTTDVGRFGIDIWMTTNVIVKRFRICEARLGVKVHDVKDPTESLGPMFRQVVGTLFYLMAQYEENWKDVTSSRATAIYGFRSKIPPEPVEVRLRSMVEKFKAGVEENKDYWRSILPKRRREEIEEITSLPFKEFSFPIALWVKVVYDFVVAYKKNREKVSSPTEDIVTKLVASLVPLYFGRTASFVLETKGMPTYEAEGLIERLCDEFERRKPYLVKRWFG